jgi:U1 small nuclear ribonucleoprotein
MLNARGEPMDKESRRGRRDLGAKNPGGPTAMFMKVENPRLWALFQPRPELQYIGTVTKKKCLPLTGVAAFVDKFESTPPPPRVNQETKQQQKERLRKEKAGAHKKVLDTKIAAFREKQKRYSELHDSVKAKIMAEVGIVKPSSSSGDGDGGASSASSADSGDGDGAEGGTGLPPYMTVDPFSTLFAARLPFDTTESRLSRVFSKFGPVKKVHLVTHRDGSPRGMAFVEFEKEQDMRTAFDRADGIKLGRNLDGKDMRILVDVERGWVFFVSLGAVLFFFWGSG